MNDALTDNRFKVISSAKELLVENTNIEDSPDEMAVIDDVLFRCWQMGWLNALDELKDGGVAMDKSEVEAVEDQILNLLGNAIEDYKESLKSASAEEVAAYACRSVAASAIIVATIKTLSREYL